MQKIFLFLLLTACTSKEIELSQTEKNYNSVSDSLIKYKKEITASSMEITPIFKDYMKLDCKTFQSTYKLNDHEMEILAQSFTVTYQIFQTMKSIENNISSSEEIRRDSLFTAIKKEKTDYKFYPSQR